MFPSGITHEEMVQESKRHWQRLEQNAQKQQKVREERALRQLDISHCFLGGVFSSSKYGNSPCTANFLC